MLSWLSPSTAVAFYCMLSGFSSPTVVETNSYQQAGVSVTFAFVCHRDDCSKELLEWGSRVAAANSRLASPQ